MPPRTLGPYEVLSVIGRGGIGTVYRGRHRESGQQVAVKLLAPPPACDPAAARRLAREFEALRGLHHPNVVRVFEAGVHEGYSFLAMELVEGLDLRSYLSPMLDEAGERGTSPRAADCGEPGGPPRADGDERRNGRPDQSEPGACPHAADCAEGGATPCPLELGDQSLSWSDEPETESLLTAHDARPSAGGDAIRAFAAMMEEPETDPCGSAPGGGVSDPGRARPAFPRAQPLPAALAGRLNRPGRVERLHDAFFQVCQGLAYVHGRGLVHRDLKPSNIMVDDSRRVRLMDFGLVKLAGDSSGLTQHGRVVGTYRYMAPEQARGEPVDRRADLYSLGVILFELLCGRPPFMARLAPELWNQIVSVPPPPVLSLNPGAPPDLARVAERLLAKDPRERFQSAEQVMALLRG